MSRVGKAPIQLPKGVSIDIDGTTVAVKGPKGELTRRSGEQMEDGIDASLEVNAKLMDKPTMREKTLFSASARPFAVG